MFATTTVEGTQATVLKFDNKSTSYKLALLQAINDLVLANPELTVAARDVAIPLRRIAEHWIAYSWPLPMNSTLFTREPARSAMGCPATT